MSKRLSLETIFSASKITIANFISYLFVVVDGITLLFRYSHLSDVANGYHTDAWKCIASGFFGIFNFRYSWRASVARKIEK